MNKSHFVLQEPMNFLDFMPLYINCGISFSSDWYYHNAGISMDEHVLRDPAKKFQADIARTRFIEQKYPHIFMQSGIPRDESSFRPHLGYGVTTLASALGARIRFDPHLDPTPVPTVDLFKINIVEDIKVPDMQDALMPIFKEIDAYVDMGYSKSEIAMFNNQGPLNIALEAFGDKQMLSLISRRTKEAEVRHILEVTSDVFIEGTRITFKELGRPIVGRWTVAGCTYVYLSPKHWTKYVIPIIEKCVNVLGNVGLHHCGVANDAQVEAYSQIEWYSLEFGFGTDIAHVRKKIVNEKLGPLDISCRMSPYRMLNQPASQIKKDVEWLIEKGRGGPQRIAVVGCPCGTPDDNINMLWNTVKEHNENKAKEMEDDEDE